VTFAMTFPRLILACCLPLALTACGVPDLIAHGIKEYEKTRAPAVQPAAAPAEPAQAQPAVVREEPPSPVYTGATSPVSREAIQVESLPPR
jgi:hypothetical protein